MNRIVEACGFGMFLVSLCVVMACVSAVDDRAANGPAPATTEQRLDVQSVGDDVIDQDDAIEPRSGCSAKFCLVCHRDGGDCENEGPLGCFCI